MEIKVLGSGCMKCVATEGIVRGAIEELGMDVEIQHVKEISEILSYGVMMTPAVVINDKVKCFGTIPKKEDVISWIEEEKE